MSTASSTLNLRQRLVGGGAWALVGKGGTLALNFVTVALVARLLDPSDAGAYLLAQSLVTASAMVARLGLDNTVVFLVSRALGGGSPGHARRAIRSVVILGVSGAALVGAALSLGGGAWIGHAIFGSALVARAPGLALGGLPRLSRDPRGGAVRRRRRGSPDRRRAGAASRDGRACLARCRGLDRRAGDAD